MTYQGLTRPQVLRAAGGAAVGGALVYGSSRPTRGQSAETWTQFGYDDANTGHAPENTGPVADISQQ